MPVNLNVQYVQERIQDLKDKDLLSAVASFSDSSKLLIALLDSLGFDPVSVEQDAGSVKFYTVILDKRVDLVEHDLTNNRLTGPALPDLRRAFYIVKAIEGELSNAMYYPPDLRDQVINAVIKEAGADQQLYNMVLAGWKVFR